MMKPEPRLLACGEYSSNGLCGVFSLCDSPGSSSSSELAPGSSVSSLEMLTTAGESFAARSTKSGRLWIFATWPLSDSSVHKREGSLAEARVEGTRTITTRTTTTRYKQQRI